ncbi:hypothetical protein C2E23DRAFT_861683 [Lenzites betulinus]|nr:hypothetical protein C2E23DRAFT_861683 [Lenzites betulinus]
MDIDHRPTSPKMMWDQHEQEDQADAYDFDWSKHGTELANNDNDDFALGNPTTPDMTAEQIWEARLNVIESLDITPEPAEGFPDIHFRSSKDLIRHHHPMSIQMITGMPEVDVEAPPRPGPGVRKWDAGTAWLSIGLWPGAAEVLLRLKFISTSRITFSVHGKAEEPQKFLAALTGFTSWGEEEVRRKVLSAMKTNPAFTSIKNLVTTHPDYQRYRDKTEAMMRVIDTVKVKVRQVTTKTGEMPLAFVYMDPPTTSAQHWEGWKCGLEMHVFPNLTGRVKLAARDFRCKGCHGADHQNHQIAPRPNYFGDTAATAQYTYHDNPRSPRPQTPAATATIEQWPQDLAGWTERAKQDKKRRLPAKPVSKRA